MLLKKATKRSEKTLRVFWLKSFPQIPLTRKPKGLRMGKGKGKRDTWFAKIPNGSILIEFKNLRQGRAIYFINQIKYRLPIQSYLIFGQNFNYIFTFNKNLKILYKLFWH